MDLIQIKIIKNNNVKQSTLLLLIIILILSNKYITKIILKIGVLHLASLTRRVLEVEPSVTCTQNNQHRKVQNRRSKTILGVFGINFPDCNNPVRKTYSRLLQYTGKKRTKSLACIQKLN